MRKEVELLQNRLPERPWVFLEGFGKGVPDDAQIHEVFLAFLRPGRPETLRRTDRALECHSKCRSHARPNMGAQGSDWGEDSWGPKCARF